MASSLNASTSGGGGVIVTSDASGNLDIQSGGSTVVAVTSAGATVTGTLSATGAVTLTGSLNTPNTFGFKNRIINGGMVIDQRNAGASVALTSAAKFITDRFAVRTVTGTGNTAIQSTTATTGFVNSLLVTIGTGASPAANENNYILQSIEGFNIADLGWGTANAKTVTLSFQVRSSLTGTFGGALRNSAGDRSYPYTYTISSANTWTPVSVTIAGDTSGTWLTNNGEGIGVFFDLGTGSTFQGTAGAWAATDYRAATGCVKLVSTSSANIYITGVQLEKGSTATSFDFRDYGRELIMCQRYALMIKNGTTSIDRFGLGSTVNATAVQMLIQHPVAFRATPTLTTTGTAADYQVYSTAVTACNAAPTLGEGSQFNSRINFITAGGLTGGQVSQCSGANTNAYLLFSAEL